jgi:GTP-binding protein Era
VRAGSVGLVGWTNVGKSTLLNRLIGQKIAAVADVAQTTRNRIVGVRTDRGEAQYVFVDTPGIHDPRHRMNRTMVRIARETLRGVDVAVLIVDAVRGFGPGDRRAASWVRESGVPKVLALNKVDLVRPKTRLLPMLQSAVETWGFEDVVPISALTGDGCDRLLGCVRAHLPESDPLFPEDYLTDQSERSLVAEFVRERLLHATREELPHSIAVLVDEWDEGEDGVVRIEVSILVERESQKPIVIGRDGGVLREVGTAARLELERLLGRRLFLKLWVRVREGWRDDRGTLSDLGLT